jgi:hypothetical protein
MGVMKRAVSLTILAAVILSTFSHAQNAEKSRDKKDKETPIAGGCYSIQQMLDEDSLTGALRVFTCHEDPLQWKMDLLTRAYAVFDAGENATYRPLLADPQTMNLIESSGMTLLGGPMLGQISETGATVWVHTVGPAAVAVQITDGDQPWRTPPLR